MKPTISVLLVFLTSVTLSAADSAAGGKLFAQKCKACHGADGRGNPAIAKALKVTLRPLGSKEVQAQSDADLTKFVAKGSGKMKAVAGLSAADTANAVAFVRTLRQ